MDKLDFLVCGVPRSGTTVIQELLNSIPGVVCFSELFDESHNHARLRYLHALKALRADDNLEEDKRIAVEHFLGTLGTFRDLTPIVGNKQPRYYLKLSQLCEDLSSSLPLFLCVRDVGSICDSYDRRAAMGVAWDAGNTSIFAIGEQILMYEQVLLARNNNVFIVPQACIRGSEVVLAYRLSNCLGIKEPVLDKKIIDYVSSGDVSTKHSSIARQGSAQARRVEFIERFKDNPIEEILNKANPFFLSELGGHGFDVIEKNLMSLWRVFAREVGGDSLSALESHYLDTTFRNLMMTRSRKII